MITYIMYLQRLISIQEVEFKLDPGGFDRKGGGGGLIKGSDCFK